MASRPPESGHALRLASHVRACHSDGQVILLDLRRSKYLGVGGRHLAALGGIVTGWPAHPSGNVAHATLVELQALTRPLLAQGILTMEPRGTRRDPCVEEATGSLNALDANPHPSFGLGRMGHFLAATTGAALRLRCQSLHRIALDVRARRLRCETSYRPCPPDALGDAVAAYEKLRPLMLTARDKCLYDSLALTTFLAAEGMFPRWVIGVKTQPFGAHSWVQSGGIVLNDLHEHVRRFQPILVV